MKKIILLLALLLLCSSLYIIKYHAFKDYVMMRLLTVLLFTPFFIYYKGYKRVGMQIVFLLFIFFEVMAIDIQSDTLYSKIMILSRFFLYTVLLVSVVKQLNFKIISGIPIIILGFIGLLNMYLLYELISSVEIGVLDIYHKAITVAASIALVLACIAAANYNFNKLNLKSIFFLIFVYCLSFSDITSFSGFYLDYDVLYYSERFLAITGYYCLIQYIS